MTFRRRNRLLVILTLLLVGVLALFAVLTFQGVSTNDLLRINRGMPFQQVVEILGDPSYPPHKTPHDHLAVHWEVNNGYVLLLFDPERKLVAKVPRRESTIPMLMRRVRWKLGWS